jgi:hypothetical protein
MERRPLNERRCECCGHRWSIREPTSAWHTWCAEGAAWWRQITEWVTAVEEQRACFEVASNLIGAGAVEYRRKCFGVAANLIGAGAVEYRQACVKVACILVGAPAYSDN